MQGADEDSELLARIIVGDRKAMSRLMARHQLRVFQFVKRRVTSEAVAEEVANEVFLEAWRAANRFAGNSSVSTWLLAIAHNRAASVMRRRREEAWNDERESAVADAGDDPEITAQKLDKSAVIRRCIQKLSPDHREIIDLVYYHEQSVAEVGEILAIPEATVKTRMFYARKKLGELLKAAGVDRGWP